MSNSNLKLKTDLKHDVVSRACYRARRGAEIANRLQRAAVALGSSVALTESDLLRRCADPENLFTASDLQSIDGELYEGHGTLWSCNGRLCPSCMAARRRRSRARVREGCARVQPRSGSHWRLVTLTAPTLPGLSLLQVREVFNTAWSLLRKRDWWRKLVHAGVKGEEFTLGDARLLEREGREWSLEQDGFNFHLHALIYSGWIVWSRLGKEWTDCLRTAAARLNVSLTFNTSHGRAVVDVRLVVNRETKAKGTIRLKGAIEEVSKYITKSESWLKVPDVQLVEVASVPRWFRAVELLGECRVKHDAAARPVQRCESEPETGGAARVLDFRRAEALRLAEWVEDDPRAGGSTYDGEDAWLGRVGDAAFAYLDTKNLSDGSDGSRTAEIVPKRVRGKPLRLLAREMDNEQWIEMINHHIEQVREWRRTDLAMRFQYASFRDLAGRHVWYGLKSNPASLQARK